MNDYQKEQIKSLGLVRAQLPKIKTPLLDRLSEQLSSYYVFRRETDEYLQTYFSGVCSESCYRNQRSACCSKDGIITFFADVVINAINTPDSLLDKMEARLQTPNIGFKCVYLSESGCLWHIKPIVCQMFLCDKAQTEVFEKIPSARDAWSAFNERKKEYTWPDRPVLFDLIETLFLDLGLSSSLMYLNNSPGLLRVKQQASFKSNSIKP